MSRPKRAATYRTTLPNAGSKGQTPASLAIDVHYLNIMLVERWNWPRFVKLCAFLKLTPCELASIVFFPHRQIPSYETRGFLPLASHHASAVAMHLTLLEAHVMKGATTDLIENPYPNLATV